MSTLEKFEEIRKRYENGIYNKDDIKFLIDIVENLDKRIKLQIEDKRLIQENFKNLKEENEHYKFLLTHYKLLFYNRFGKDAGNHIPQIDYLDFEGMR